MQRLLIRHTGDGMGFEVHRVDNRGSKSAPGVTLVDPLGEKLGGSDLTLGHELAWYLENYLDLPIGPNVDRAVRLLAALRLWGKQSFEALFGQGQARDFYRDATRAGHAELHLVVASDSPRVLSWPWEALRDPQVGDLAHLCRIERQLDEVPEPLPLPDALPQDQVRILLVTARPLRNDVAYRSITRPLVELIRQEQLPAEVTLLRPPTFAQLQRELTSHPGRYHIVHFDGHGGFGAVAGGGRDRFRGPQGQLLFENAEGAEDPVSAEQLSQLLREHRIPIAVLNACQSAMLTEQAEDAFASVATALLRAGVRSVVAMGYSLYVDGARQFLPAFYLELFRSGNVAQATRSGRQAMYKQPERGGIELQDWLVPVLYQQDPLELSFAGKATAPPQTLPDSIPPEARVEASHSPHGVIGRDSAVLALERASRRQPPALLLHGLGGVGKTTLARGYIEWLAHTQGLPDPIIWQSLADVRSFDYLRNRLVEELFGTNAMALPDGQKWPALTKALRERAALIVWDNFESASGTADAGTADEFTAMSTQDRRALKHFLESLRGGRSKVLITSRSDEQWLGTTACFRVPLGGLQGEERRELARAILADHGARLDPRDAETAKLIDSLLGHPLMMRAILPKLASQTAERVLVELDRYQPQSSSEDPVEQRLHTTLRYVENGLPEVLRPLLMPIGLHEGYVYADFLAAVAKESGQSYTLAQVSQALEMLEVAGLVRGVGNYVYEMHPALGRYLRTPSSQTTNADMDAVRQQAWEQGFCAVMAGLANHCAPKQLHEQRPIFELFGGSFERALALSLARGELNEVGALQQAQAVYAFNTRNLPLAAQRFEAYAATCERRQREDLEAAPYQQLGRVAQKRRDFDAAEAWYSKSLAIIERQGNEYDAAQSYGQLGDLALDRRNFDTAEAWYRKALVIFERQDNDYGAASTYHQLGMVAEERRDFDAAEAWCRKALAIQERQNNEQGEASTYHQLGMVAQKRHNFDAAEAWYSKALEIFERQNNELGVAQSYGKLGNLALDRRNFDTAEAWYSKALAIFERQDNEHNAAGTYYQLGIVAQERRDFDAAEAWYRKALAIQERQNNEHDAASTYYQLGMVAEERRDFDAAEAWYRKALAIQERQNNEHDAARTYHRLGMVAQERHDFDAAETWYHKALAIFEHQDNEHDAAVTCHQLGIVAQVRHDFDAAETWYRKALAIQERQNNERGAAITYFWLGMVAQERHDFDAAETWYRKSLAIVERQNNEQGAASTYNQLGMVAEERRDFDAAETWYCKSLAICERLDAHSTVIVQGSLARVSSARQKQTGYA